MELRQILEEVRLSFANLLHFMNSQVLWKDFSFSNLCKALQSSSIVQLTWSKYLSLHCKHTLLFTKKGYLIILNFGDSECLMLFTSRIVFTLKYKNHNFHLWGLCMVSFESFEEHEIQTFLLNFLVRWYWDLIMISFQKNYYQIGISIYFCIYLTYLTW